jgi:hypothetical protein
LQLLSGFTRQPRNLRQVWIDQARESNQTATKILLADKEIGLLQYYGVTGYIREKKWLSFPSFSSLTSSSSPLESSSSPSLPNGDKKPSKVAKVAFMVTSSMRAELTDRLGYDADQLRKLTPLQATLILEHDVTSADQFERLPSLVQAHQDAVETEANRQRAEQEREQEAKSRVLANQQQQRDQQQEEQPVETSVKEDAPVPSEGQVEPPQLLSIGATSSSNTSSSTAEEPRTEPVSVSATPPPPPSGVTSTETPTSSASSNIMLHEGLHEPSRQGTLWYEIIEKSQGSNNNNSNNDGGDDDDSSSESNTPEVVALYKSQQEAELGLETKQLFATRRAKERGLENPTSTFEIRTTLKY